MFDVELNIKFRIKEKDCYDFIKEIYQRKVPMSFDGYNLNAYLFNPEIQIYIPETLIPNVKLEMRQTLDIGGRDE